MFQVGIICFHQTNQFPKAVLQYVYSLLDILIFFVIIMKKLALQQLFSNYFPQSIPSFLLLLDIKSQRFASFI